MAKTLELGFLTAGGKKVNLTVDEPKEGLTAAEVRERMEAVIASGVFGAEGHPLAEVSTARIIAREVTDLIMA
ncbi:DUF2922 domain-containing protein [Edaphobacillus lindanitolerans]|uniref:DUF2922 domain-containing protein n=1 Tax=Edaphobacillus lindanitolerans TaxID=550447 RepID=A0A1U7PLJ2_9BACI|nr:DUF2922 domain-containing protein [Edaphobacillus lindanitolerans]SIT81154.1 Protein of unknown function [Edaphobacillus lindanitolerans]